MVLGAAEGLHPLAVLRPGLVDVAGDRRAADEADRANVRVLEDPIDGHPIALDDVEDAVGHACLGQQLGDVERGRWVLLGRLEDERVAAGDRVGEHPHRDHGRKVERGDAGDDTQGLANLIDVDPARDLLAEAALEEVWDPRRELEVLETAGNLTEGVRRYFAMLGREVGRQVRPMLVDEVPDTEHDLGPARQRRRAPAGERGLCCGDGCVDVRGRGEVDLAGQPPRGRVVDRTGPSRRPGDQLATDPVMDSLAARRRVRPGRTRRRDLRHVWPLILVVSGSPEWPARRKEDQITPSWRPVTADVPGE